MKEFLKDFDLKGLTDQLQNQYNTIESLIDKVGLTEEEKKEVQKNLAKFRKDFGGVKK